MLDSWDEIIEESFEEPGDSGIRIIIEEWVSGATFSIFHRG